MSGDDAVAASAASRLDFGSVDSHRRALAASLEATGLSVQDVWLRAFALGGTTDLFEIEAYLQGLIVLPGAERDILAHAINEYLVAASGPGHVPYSSWLRDPQPDSGLPAALTTLLDGGQYCPPQRLPALADAAAQLLGVRALIYLVDYDQRLLTPMPGVNHPGTTAVPVEGSDAGTAYQGERTVAPAADPQPRFWVPMLDGDQRLGVVDVMVDRPSELFDAHLQHQVQWLAGALGHLVAVASTRGDLIPSLRRGSARTPGAELISSLLPPLTAGVDDFVISGLLAPTHALGSDMFDYALSEQAAEFAVFDAMGHGLGAGLVAAVGLASYRAARRNGLGLEAQAASIDGALREHFPDAFVTGVLAGLDVATGRLCYLNAGHAGPLLVRRSRVVKTLTDGLRLPLGLPGGDWTLGEEHLEPGDCLVLYTDGIVKARSADGAPFGDGRFVDLLEAPVPGDQPPSETVRRILQAVLEHQAGALQDDATLLLAQWRTG